MAKEAGSRAKSLGIRNAKFYTSDLESVKGKYNTVTCVDVAIHYPTEKMAEMVGHLCSLADERVMISFAPKTWYYSLLKKIGELLFFLKICKRFIQNHHLLWITFMLSDFLFYLFECVKK